MINPRKARQRGHANYGWLDTFHTFSFGTYQDPNFNNFRNLRVINEDFVSAGEGFGMHPHRDMEIVTYVLSGALKHQDSMGNGQVLRPGEFQRMTAGTGITHSEFNDSQTDPVHLYQVWLVPQEKDLPPSYEQKPFPQAERLNQLRLVASPDAQQGSLLIHQDARIYLATLEQGRTLSMDIAKGRHAWLQVMQGSVSVNRIALDTGDGAAISDESYFEISALSNAEILLFDLA